MSEEIINRTNFNIIRSDRCQFASSKSGGGGICSCTSDRWSVTESPLDFRSTVEVHCFQLKTNEDSVIFFNVYAPPLSNKVQLEMDFNRILDMITASFRDKHVIMVGDFNLSSIKWVASDSNNKVYLPDFGRAHRLEKAIVLSIQNFGFSQVNPKSNIRGNWLDLVFTNKADLIDFDISSFSSWDRDSGHHSGLSFCIKTKKCAQDDITIRSKRKINLKRLKDQFKSLSLPPWANHEIPLVLTELPDDVSDYLHVFTGQVQSAITACSKVASISEEKRSAHPWTRKPSYQTQLRNCRKARSTYCSAPTMDNKVALKEAFSKLRSVFADLKRDYYRRLLTEAAGSSKLFYDCLSNKKITKEIPHQLTMDGLSFSGVERALGFKQLFEQNFIGVSSFDDDFEVFSDQIGDIHRQFYSEAHSTLWTNFHLDISMKTLREIITDLRKENDGCALGIPPSVVKIDSKHFRKVLVSVLNIILKTGYIPPNWKEGDILPIPKKGNSSFIENYRGIALQSSLLKVLDIFITSKLDAHLGSIIPESQHGFRKKRSTLSNLLRITHDIALNSARANATDVIYIDFSKAFDRADHLTLARKLCALSIPLPMLRLVIGLITNRKYFVKMDGERTNQVVTTFSGVPQGSHCGPLLFAILCADITSCVGNSTVRVLQYADDLKIYNEIRDDSDVTALQETLDRLCCWASLNKLTINPTKTIFVSYRGNRHTTRSYRVDGLNIAPSQTVKDLGIRFDSRLTFKDHYSDIISKSRSLYYAARRFCKDAGDRKLIVRIVNTFIAPIQEYCGPIWYRNRVGLNKQLEWVHHQITRIALGTAHRPHLPNYVEYNERCNLLGIPSFEARSAATQALLIVKLIKGCIDSDLGQTMSNLVNQGPTSLRSRNLIAHDRRVIAPDSPLDICTAAANRLSHRFSLDDNYLTIKRAIRRSPP